jgi:hypothetical protein
LPNWIDLIAYIKGHVVNMVSGIADEANNLATRNYFNNVKHKIGPLNLRHYLWDIRDTESTMKIALDMYSKFEAESNRITDSTNISKVATLARELDIPVSNGTPDPNIDVMIKMVHDRYPLLKIIPIDHWNRNFNHINYYINLTDTAWMYFELSASPPIVEED